VIKPEVVVGDAHFVKCDLFGVLEEAVGSPDVMQPLDVQNAVLLLHVLRQAQPGVTPSLCQENIRDVSLPQKCEYQNLAMRESACNCYAKATCITPVSSRLLTSSFVRHPTKI
jgi:hypothetical protein